MPDTCPTVRITSEGPTGWADLDESAFDPAIHTLWQAPQEVAGGGSAPSEGNDTSGQSQASTDNPTGQSDEPLTVDAVLQLADTVPFLSFKAAAGKLLGDDLPATKVEIIAALQAKASA